MAEAVANPNELRLSRELAREKLNALKSGRRGWVEQENVGTDSSSPAAIGDDESTPSESNDQSSEWQQNDENRAGRFSQLQARRAARRENADGAQRVVTAEQGASAVARQAYTRVWQLAEEGVHAFAFSFLDLMLISGPAALVMFVVRFVGGNLMGGSGTMRFREASVPRIPGYPDAISGIYIFGKILLIGLLTGLIYALLIFVIILLVNPVLVAQIGFCIYFDGLLKLIGAQCTA